MILVKYITKELCKNQLIVFFVLLLVCLCQKFLKMLHLAVYENISIYLFVMCIGLNMPELGKLIIPCSVFISVPITFYRLYVHNEILAMYACSVDKYIFVKSILFFSGVVLIFAWFNISWLSPYCGHYQNALLSEIRKNINLVVLTEKRFQLLENKCLVIFIEHIQRKRLNRVFLVRHDKDTLTAIIAKQGDVYYLLNELNVILNSGICYEIYNKKNLYEDICVSEFLQCQMCFDRDVKTVWRRSESNYMSMCQLWHACSYESRVELHWRLTLLISIVIMSIIAMLLFIKVAPHYFLLVALMMCLYITFFFFHILLRFYIFVDVFYPIMWMWGVNIIYCVIAGVLFLWNSYYIKEILLKIRH